MNISNQRALALTLLLSLIFQLSATAQPPTQTLQGWEVSVNPMPDQTRRRITHAAEQIQQSGGATRGVVSQLLSTARSTTVGTIINVVSDQVINLINLRRNQKAAWMAMIRNENTYTDSIENLKGLNDFYSQTSRAGALDPSNINFDGITVRGFRAGREMLSLSCHIDTTRLDHLFNHSKFYLVVDSIAFRPDLCHLPNLAANGIRATDDTYGRDCSYRTDERHDLTVSMELTLSSSWVNEAVMVQRDVELGTFNLSFRIPDNTTHYTYSRAATLDRIARGQATEADLITVCGDCFVVPRSYMPLSGTERMWGTGEYNIKVRLRESCQFNNDERTNPKLANWHDDYRQLLRLQRRGTPANVFFKTIWQQQGETFIKSLVKQELNSMDSALGLSGSSSTQGMGGAQGAAGVTGGASAGGAQPAGTSPGGAQPSGAAGPAPQGQGR